MEREIIVITSTPMRDMMEFVHYFEDYINKYEGNFIYRVYMKDGTILRFHYNRNLEGLDRYYYYHEIFENYLKFVINNQKKEKESLIKYLEDKLEEISNKGASYGITIDREIAEYIGSKIKVYQEILDKIKEGNYE